MKEYSPDGGFRGKFILLMIVVIIITGALCWYASAHRQVAPASEQSPTTEVAQATAEVEAEQPVETPTAPEISTEKLDEAAPVPQELPKRVIVRSSLKPVMQ